MIKTAREWDIPLGEFPLLSSDKLRYADTDQQGHINNALFSTFLETGRVELLQHLDLIKDKSPFSFVIASLQLDFIQQLYWPGQVHIATGILKIGTSSIHLHQALFQDQHCVARANTVIVQIENMSAKAVPFGEVRRQLLKSYQFPEI
ncbi:acyl-CoA thioesterase [Croceimicrobium sp.]|uniref:acyl-CoA thioesterase n=1 Tax=Croceimicrobium sp. TaxID=2828340 RepID=UPI003BAD6F58